MIKSSNSSKFSSTINTPYYRFSIHLNDEVPGFFLFSTVVSSNQTPNLYFHLFLWNSLDVATILLELQQSLEACIILSLLCCIIRQRSRQCFYHERIKLCTFHKAMLNTCCATNIPEYLLCQSVCR